MSTGPSATPVVSVAGASLWLRNANQLRARHLLRSLSFAGVLAGIVLLPATVQAAESHSKNALDALMQTPFNFPNPIARGLSLGGTVIGFLMLDRAKSTFKRTLGGILFGLGMAIVAANWLTISMFLD